MANSLDIDDIERQIKKLMEARQRIYDSQNPAPTFDASQADGPSSASRSAPGKPTKPTTPHGKDNSGEISFIPIGCNCILTINKTINLHTVKRKYEAKPDKFMKPYPPGDDLNIDPRLLEGNNPASTNRTDEISVAKVSDAFPG